MLKSHDRYSYVPITEREPYDWPNGERLAIYVALNVEQFPFGEGLGVPVAPAQPDPDVVNFSWRDYGNRVVLRRRFDDVNSISFVAVRDMDYDSRHGTFKNS